MPNDPPDRPAGSARVMLYTKPDCADCFNAKRYLANRHVNYTMHNLADEAAVNQLLDLLGPGHYATPIIVIDRHVFSGFAANREHIDHVLAQKGLSGPARRRVYLSRGPFV